MTSFHNKAKKPPNSKILNGQCIACGAENMIELGKHALSSAPASHGPTVLTAIMKCPICGLIFRKLPSNKFLTNYFNNSWHTAERARSSWLHKRRDYFRRTFHYLNNKCTAIKERKRILDVGCSYGGLLSVFAENGWDVHGIERYKGAAKYGDMLGLNIIAGLMEKAKYPQNYFDLITFIDALGYMENPALALKKAYYSLKPSGLIYMRIANRKLFFNIYFWLSKLGFLRSNKIKNRLVGDGIWVFSQRSLMILLKETGFTKVELSSDISKLKRRGLLIKVLYFLSSAVSFITLNHIILPPGLTVVARRR